MRVRKSIMVAVVFVCLFLPASLAAQQITSTATSTQVSSLLQQSLAVLTGGSPVTDVTMTGSVTATAGPSPESGTITLVATGAGGSRVTFTMPSGTRINVENYSANPRTGSWTGPDGTVHAHDLSDLMGPSPAWFCPTLLISSAGSPNYAASYIGQETRQGIAVQHVRITPNPAIFVSPIPSVIPSLRSLPLDSVLGQNDLYLDTSSLLPTALVRLVPSRDHDGSVAPVWKRRYVPEEIRFSDYRTVEGRPVAFHIQVYLGRVLHMDIQLSSVNFNTGAAVAN